jgi:acyl-CoA hydrolase/ribosomal protein S18 acetylase RimI-like enzyme
MMDYLKWLNDHCPEKVVEADKAISKIKPGSRVFIGTGCGEPQYLIRTMVQSQAMDDITLYQMLSQTLADYVDDESFLTRFSLKLFFISLAMRKAAFEGKIDYIPAYLSQIPQFFYSRRIGLDAALIQVSPPDRFGNCSLGVSVDITRAGMDNSPLVIAQVNPRMPRTAGDSFVHVDEIDYLVLHEEPLVVSLPRITETEVARRIGHYVSQLVENGATLHLGFGQLPYSVLPYLDNKKNLGIHTHLISDAFLPLFKKKIVSGKKKTFLPGRVVASLCMGSEEIYNHVHDNPMFYFRSSEFVNNPTIIANNDNLISISSALEVDLTGQICSDSMGYRFFSGLGDQVDFLRGSTMSKGGFSIIVLPSTAENGTVSRIVPHLSEGAGVATTRGDVNFVVTEYGIAELQGKSIYQRVVGLTQVAHPKFREDLMEAAKEHHYIFSDQLPPRTEDLLFLDGYTSALKLKNGKTVEFRPLLASDELASRAFFYSLTAQSIYYRFFSSRRIFSREDLQKILASQDYRKNITMIGLVRNRGVKEVMATGSYGMVDENTAEVAFIVREDFQGMGIASYLLEVLEKIARENHYKAFSAYVLRENAAMIHVFKKRYPNLKRSKVDGGDIEILMNFGDTVES